MEQIKIDELASQVLLSFGIEINSPTLAFIDAIRKAIKDKKGDVSIMEFNSIKAEIENKFK